MSGWILIVLSLVMSMQVLAAVLLTHWMIWRWQRPTEPVREQELPELPLKDEQDEELPDEYTDRVTLEDALA